MVPDRPSLPVVFSEFMPDSVFSFRLSRTQNITDRLKEPPIENATIEIMNGDSSIYEVLTHGSDGRYASNWLKPEVGGRYIIRVNRPEGELWVDETMPDTLQCRINDTGRVAFMGRSDFFQIRLRVSDRASEKEYYGLRLLRTYRTINGQDTQYGSRWVDIESMDILLNEDPVSRFSKKHLLFTDRSFNGQTREILFGVAGLFSNPAEKTISIELFVSGYSEQAFRYYASVNEHLLYQNDPFSQPTGIQGNVTGALGAAVGQVTRTTGIFFE